LLDQPDLLQQRNELQRRHQAQAPGSAADQRLDSDDASTLQIHFRLVVQDELVSLQRPPQLVLERQLLRDALGHLRGIEQITFALGFRPLERRFRVPESVSASEPSFGKSAIPALALILSSVSPMRNGGPKTLCIRRSTRRATSSSDCAPRPTTAKVVRADSSDARRTVIVLRHPLGDLLQQRVALLTSKRVVMVLIVPHRG